MSRIFWLFGAVAFAALLLNAVPYVIAYNNTPPGSVYSGLSFLYTDTPTYYAKMQSGYNGNFLYTNLFTTETPNPAVPFHLFYTILGMFTRFIGSDVASVFFAARFFFGFVFLFSIFLFCVRFTKSRGRAILSFILASFASGFAWFFLLLSWTPHDLLDIYIPAFIPLARYSSAPHVSLASVLFIFALYGVFSYKETRNKKFLGMTACAVFFENLILPYYAIGLYAVIGLYSILALFAKHLSVIQFRAIFIAICASLSSFAFMFYVAFSNPLWKTSQIDIFLRPFSLAGFFIGFGFLALFALGEIILRFKQRTALRDAHFLILVCWIIAPLILAFIPAVPQRRRMLEVALIVPLSILSSDFLFFAWKKMYDALIKQIRVFVLAASVCVIAIFMALSSLVVIYLAPWNLKTEATSTLFYMPKDLLRAREWVREHSGSQDAALSSTAIGNMVPFLFSRYVYVGHWSETARYFEKARTVQNFYQGTLSETEVKNLFLENRITFVLYTPYERAIGTQGIKRYSQFLKKDFETGDTTLYHVVLPSI